MKNLYCLLIVLLNYAANAQDYFTFSNDSLTLNNGSITRIIRLSGDSLISEKLWLNNDKKNYIKKSREFSFTVDDREMSGYNQWKLIKTQPIGDENGGKGVRVILKSLSTGNSIEIKLNYLLYPDLPLIRKWLEVTNKGIKDIKLESVNVEDLNSELSVINSVVYHNYGRMKQLGSFTGRWDDPVVVVHDAVNRRGIALGNEAEGVLKRSVYHTTYENIEIGLTHSGDDYPFRKWLKPGESWESPKTFICLYSGRDDGYSVIDNEVNLFLGKFMKPQFLRLRDKPVFVYNTWNPFRTFVSDTLVRRVAKAAADCGMQEFIIDDGWQVNHGGKSSVLGWGNNYGDWEVDTLKFPGGLKPTFDYIKSLGMKPGLWISIGSATKDSRVFREHPDWFIRVKNGMPGNLHLPGEQTDFYTSCFGTGWYDYIKGVILRLVKDYGLAYAKLDFAIVTSPYVNDPSRAGCYATGHALHRDQPESLEMQYRQVLKLFDDLHREAPGLFIDCTFETAGRLQLMDYAIAEHADGDWLSNFEEPSPQGPLRVRQMAWWRSPVLPAGSLVIGNQTMDDPGFELALKSLIGTLPIVLGDPTRMPPDKREIIKKWSDWMHSMETKYDYISFRKDLAGFGEPREGCWDGWQRINFFNGQGGVFGVFRQGALENSRVVFLSDLRPESLYLVRSAPDGKTVFSGSGRELMNNGFPVKIDSLYDGKIFEVGIQ